MGSSGAGAAMCTPSADHGSNIGRAMGRPRSREVTRLTAFSSILHPSSWTVGTATPAAPTRRRNARRSHDFVKDALPMRLGPDAASVLTPYHDDQALLLRPLLRRTRMAKRMRRRQFVGLAVVAGFGSGRRPDLLEELAAPSVLQEDPRFQEIGRLISSRMAEHRIPGVGFGLFKNGRSALRGFGLTNLDNPQPVTPDTVFPIASISTTVATAIMRLVEEGRVDRRYAVTSPISGFRTHPPPVMCSCGIC